MNMHAIILVLAMLIPGAATAKQPVKGISVDSLQILRISGQNQRAVVKTPEGTMAVLKQGDVLQDGQAQSLPELRVVEITRGRIVLEEKTDSGIEKIIIRLIDGKQTVERIRRTRQEPPLTHSPATGSIISIQPSTERTSR
jgi:hypothetical protein